MKKQSDFDRGVAFGMGLACAIAAAENVSGSSISRVLNAAGLDRRKLKRLGLSQYDLDHLENAFGFQRDTKPFQLHPTFITHFPHSVIRPDRARHNESKGQQGVIHPWLVEQFGAGIYRSSKNYTQVRRDCTVRWAFSDWSGCYHFRHEKDAALFKLFWIDGN